MCYPVQCGQCGKTTWGGCGAHVAQVFARVPQEQRCRCNEESASDDKEQNQKPPAKSAIFGKGFGR